MKNILKKNQVIITALALMLAIAGYLQMTGNTKNKENAKPASSQGTIGDYSITDGAIEDYFTDLSDEDLSPQELAASENQAAKDAAVETNTGTGEPAGQDGIVDSSAEDTDDPGAAILVSTTIRGDFALNAKMYREQTRAKNKAILMELLADEKLTEAQREETIDTLLSMTAKAEMELAAEMLLEAKGFPDAVCNIVGEEVDVVINAESVTDRQIAQIEDIVARKTGTEIKNIKIMAAIQQD